ncbi:spore coat polysaccharide biosynthesis protein SpsF [Gracilibacillus orientalis]|uniref:Spore coat polysaccharide biosynthesis protein SpsF n=1 Tax=Gracilibacillus orientalis TaxID=334253 RepID=A0A1I4MTF9_9BACI|nr:glycosyltransferase family protein [Gracilibacillus orientalis]SFM06592.1 spore coat polysaccharide biosynthesis protein SpsF [Gracilibacillus orientalis]
MKIVAIIQARMGSTRLPGKVLRKVVGKPLIKYQIDRIRESSYLDEIVIATTNNKKDDAIVDFCRHEKVRCVRGSEKDVVSRYLRAAEETQADVIVRFTADCPLIDADTIDQVIKAFVTKKIADYVTNVQERTYPRGYDIEVFTMQTLEKISKIANRTSDREHVTTYIRDHPDQFHIYNVFHHTNYSSYRLTVDTLEDFQLIEKIIKSLEPKWRYFTLEDVITLLEHHPDWVNINANIEQKGW